MPTEQELKQDFTQYYLKLLGKLSRWHDAGGKLALKALKDFDDEWPLMKRTLSYSEDRQAEYAVAGIAIINFRLHPIERISWFEAAINAAQQLKHPHAVDASGQIPDRIAQQRAQDKAMALYERQKAMCLKQGNKKGLAVCYGNQAVILYNWGRFDAAKALYDKQEALKLKKWDGLAVSYGN